MANKSVRVVMLAWLRLPGERAERGLTTLDRESAIDEAPMWGFGQVARTIIDLCHRGDNFRECAGSGRCVGFLSAVRPTLPAEKPITLFTSAKSSGVLERPSRVVDNCLRGHREMQSLPPRQELGIPRPWRCALVVMDICFGNEH